MGLGWFVLGFAELSANPESPQIGEGCEQHQNADWEAEAFIGQCEVDCAVGRGVVEEYAEDGAEGRREERRKP